MKSDEFRAKLRLERGDKRGALVVIEYEKLCELRAEVERLGARCSELVEAARRAENEVEPLRAALELLLIDLLDEWVPMGELRRLCRAIRQSMIEGRQDEEDPTTRGVARELLAELLEGPGLTCAARQKMSGAGRGEVDDDDDNARQT